MKRIKGKHLDFAQIAHAVVEAATNEEYPSEESDPKKTATAESRRKSGKVGGKSRADKLTPEQRKQIAEMAAQARWKKSED